MSVDLLQPVAGWEGVSNALKEIRDCHAETQSFVNGLFEEWDLLSDSLHTQEKHLAQTFRRVAGSQPVELSGFDERLNELLVQREAEREEFRESREAVQKQVARLATVAAELASARKEFQSDFQTIREEFAKTREASALDASTVLPANDEVYVGLEQKLSELQRQHIALEQDRAVLEKELESVRNRAADLAESLAEQKRQTLQQQMQGNVELQQMRVLLETIARQSREIECAPFPVQPAAPVAPRPPHAAAAAASDPVLGSVLAQFEMLQQDRARRRV